VFFSVVGMRAVLAGEHTGISPVWPAPGVALAAALLAGGRVAPGIFLPLAAGSFLGGNSWGFSVLAPLGLTGAVYLGRALLRWRGFDVGLGGTRDVLLLAGLGAGVPMGLAGVWTAGCLWWGGQIGAEHVAMAGAIYGVANVAGAVLVAPVVLLVAAGRFLPGAMGAGWALGAAVRLAVVFLAAWVAFFGFAGGGVSAQALAYLPFPFLVWMALSRGLAGAALAVLVTAGMAVVATSRGAGPFAGGEALAAFWQIEVFLAIVTTSGLLIGAGSDAQRRERVLREEAAVRRAELERLKAQVNPHFLFNCLTAIQSLVRSDERAAEEGLRALSGLLRKSLDAAGRERISLEEELEIIREGLALQKMRFEEGLEWSVERDEETRGFPVPPMVLQPLVENAVKHGVVEGFGRVELRARLVEGDLVVTVGNTVPAGCDPAGWGEGVGLAAVRARLAEACGAGSGVEFLRVREGWVEARVRVCGGTGGEELSFKD
jgi:integral membrane sensor domain MASE1